ncbi:hypothetical protein L1049_019588 [Liquidambar formosana]|uniref:Uncharacterized protein n=1 Tax=Liquidambar formosana TaxID=63359 RepID=A0AAP0X343_LIQFO
MGKKTKKPRKGKEKTERKTAKAEETRARRDTKKISLEEDIDAILLSIQKEEAKKKEVHVEENVAAPSPLSNCSMIYFCLAVAVFTDNMELYGFGLRQTNVYGDLYWYDVEKQEWKLVSSPNSLPPHSAYQAVSWKNYLYIFGLLDVGPENKSMGTTKFERVSMSTLRHRMKEVLLNSILQQTIGTDSYKEILSDIWRLIESFLLLLCSGKK